MSSGTIYWEENRKTGEGQLVLVWEDNRREVEPYDGDPIGPSTDCQHIAGLFGGFDWVERDGDVVHVGNETD